MMKKPLKRLNNIRMKNKVNSLYIHIPFCETICDYCDFTKLQYFRLFAEKYIDRLIDELNSEVKNRKLKTIYVGGGTPTSLEDDLFLKLLKAIKPYSGEVEEYTFECNPESLSLNKIKMMKEYGVNRISIGVESTDDNILKSINRRHTFSDVKKVVALLKENGINNINLDLILGLPNVTEKMLKKDIKNILSLNPNHISCYSLTVHEHTVFYLNEITPPTEDFAFEAYKMINDILMENGYEHYEVSNWAKANYRSKHNLTYWRNEEYYGVGLGASGYTDGIRYKNSTNLNEYLKGINKKEIEEVSLKDLEEYEIMLKLRISEGLDLKEFKNKFNKDLYINKKEIVDSYIKEGYLKLENNRLIPTFNGMMILDKITLDLLD